MNLSKESKDLLCPIARGDVRPVPDPTTLTTQQLHLHTAGVREVLESRIDAAEKVIDALWERLGQFKGLIKEEVEHLKELHGTRFNGIQTQFEERDTRTEQTAANDKVALSAALNAAKEAVAEQNKSSALAIAKSEAGTTKQIDQIGEMNMATNKSTDGKIDDLKGQMATIRGQAKGLNDGWGYIVGIIGVLLALGTLLAVVFKK